MDNENRWSEYIPQEWMQGLDDTPFLKKCREGTVSRTSLERFLVQQYFYSRHFTRYLCALLSNIHNDEHRRELTENLVDETGMGKVTSTPHSRIYRKMLDRLGVDPAKSEPLPETQALIDTMWESCRSPNPAVGLGALCLGAEAIVPHIYSQIVAGFSAVGEDPNALDFFHIHIACDDEHALTMKRIIEEELTTPEQKNALTTSAARAIAARTRFFRALEVAA